MKIRLLLLSLLALFVSIPLSNAALDIDSLANHDIQMDFSMSYEENLAEGTSGSLRGTYIISTDSEDEVYWSSDYNCGFDLVITDKNPAESADYNVIYEWDTGCTSSAYGNQELISQGESYKGGLAISGKDFITDGAHYWYTFTLNTTDEVSQAVHFEPLTGDFTINFDTLDEPFSDLSGHWGANYINALATLGDVSGYTDGTFKPDQNTSRAEVIALAIKTLTDPTNDTCTHNFDLSKNYSASYTDVNSSYWGFPYIEAATEAGVVSGYSDGTFKPDQTVTRAEALSILLETYFACGDYNGIDDWYTNYDRYSSDPVSNNGEFWAAYLEQGYEVASDANLSLGFSDVSELWQRFYVHFADLHGVADGYTNASTGQKEFRPNLPVTRAELSKMAWKLLTNPHNREPF